MRPVRFRPSLRKTLAANKAALDFMAGGKPAPELDASYAQAVAGLPKQRKRRDDMSATDIDAVHRRPDIAKENEVVPAISQLLSRHPRVLIALRMNSGMASYEAASGRYAPVWFHKFLRAPEKMRMPDFFGFLVGGKPLAIEAKRPTWTQPRDDREREQAAFLALIRSIGGIGIFASSADHVAAALALA